MTKETTIDFSEDDSAPEPLLAESARMTSLRAVRTPYACALFSLVCCVETSVEARGCEGDGCLGIVLELRDVGGCESETAGLWLRCRGCSWCQ